MSSLCIPFFMFAFLIAVDLFNREEKISDDELKFEIGFGVFLMIIGFLLLIIF